MRKMSLYPRANGIPSDVMANHKYVVKVDGEVVWEGLDLERKVRELRKRYPDGKISIAWVPTEEEDILIVPAV